MSKSYKNDKVGEVWEILVPATFCERSEFAGKKIPVNIHNEWDRRVEKISGGLTILKTAKGVWSDTVTGITFKEEMIPVRIFCTVDQIIEIAKLTKTFYDQIAVMYYKISDEAFITYNEKYRTGGRVA